MSNIVTTRPNRRLSAKTLACAAFAALLAVGSFAGPAEARWGNDNDRHEDRQDWNRDQYRPPPVVYDRYYNAPTYYAPPIVYGPSYDSGFGLNINIR